MTSDKIFVLLLGGFGIGFVYWFFLNKKEKEVEAKDSIEIRVEGGYTPEVISVPKDKTTKLIFFRKEPNSCLEEVVLSDFKIRKTLPLNQAVTIPIHPKQSGQFRYSCGMNMYHGKIIVK